jgi:crotonobetainyl-CoA:carnitine CoA-transferase CaiB-like acyl-CoA transferase
VSICTRKGGVVTAGFPIADLRPLEGTLVVDLSQQLPGPFATLLLRTLGARVVKVEPPDGDVARRIDPEMFRRMAADKELVTIDLKSDAGRAELHELVAGADVFVEGFRPGVTARLGADWPALRALNPGLVYCSLSGYGAAGPLVERPGHDINYLALAAGLPEGLLDGEALIRVPWVDLAAGTNAALTILAALMQRGKTGEGRHLEIAMLDAATVWSGAKLPRPGAEGAYGVFESADGARVAVAVLEADQWRRLATAFGWEDWLEDPAFADHDGRRAEAARVTERLREAVAARPLIDLLAAAREHDVAISAVNDQAGAAADPQLAERGIYLGLDGWRPLGPVAGALPFADLAETPSEDVREP